LIMRSRELFLEADFPLERIASSRAKRFPMGLGKAFGIASQG
jgi:hypothetical protein